MTAGKRNPKTWKQRGNHHSTNTTFSTSTPKNRPTTSRTDRRTSNNRDVFDKYHNGSAPCCNGLREIVQRIFPDCHHVVASTCGRGKTGDDEVITKNNMCTDSPWSSRDNGSKSSSSSSSSISIRALIQSAQHTLQTRHNNSTKLSPPLNYQSMSLLNLMVRKFLLENRWERRQKLSSFASQEDAQVKVTNYQKKGQRDQLNDNSNCDNTTTDDDDDDVDHDNDALERFLDSFLTVSNTKNDCHHDYDDDVILNSDKWTTNGIPPIPPHRTIELFLEYIQKCTVMEKSSNGHVTGHAKRAKRQKGKNTTTVHSSWSWSSSCSSMPPIPLSDVINLVNKITCRHCQGECSEYLKKIVKAKFHGSGLGDDLVMTTMGREKDMFGVAMGTTEEEDEEEVADNEMGATGTDNDVKIITSIQLNQCSSIQDNRKGNQMSYNGLHWDGNDVENAFDYNLLEEGGVISEEEATADDDQVCKQSEKVKEGVKRGIWLDLVQDRDSGEKFFQLQRPTSCSSNSVLTVEDFESWVKDVIVSGGLIETWPFGVLEEDLQLLSTRSDSSLTDFVRILKHEMPRVLFDAHKALADAEESLKTPGAFNVKAGKALKECDQHQNIFMGYCRKLLIDLDSLTTHSRRHHHPYQKWLTQIMDELWECYMSCSFSLIEPCMRFMWEGIQLDVNRTGSVPLHFNSPQQRENLKEILKKRLLAISQLQANIERKSFQHVEGGDETSTALRYLVVLGHFFSFDQEENNTESKKSKAAIDLMLENRDKVMFEVIYNTSVNMILNAQVTRCNNLYNEISRNYTTVCDAMKNIIMCRKDKLTWQTNSIIIEESQIEYDMLQAQNSEPSLDNDIHRVQILCDFSKNVLSHYRFFQQLEISDVKDVKRIPRELLDICYGTFPSQGCHGGSGRKRIVGILSSYVYSWLEEKCIEWHAELSHQELMIETENEILQGRINCNDQKKKSKKKKKRKSAKSASPDEAKDELVCSKQRDLSLEEMPTSHHSGLNRNNADADKGIISYGKVLENVETITSQMSTKSSDLETVNATTVSSEDEHISNKEEHVQVFVSDQGNLVSIESFLCSRYFRVIKERHEHANTAK